MRGYDIFVDVITGKKGNEAEGDEDDDVASRTHALHLQHLSMMYSMNVSSINECVDVHRLCSPAYLCHSSESISVNV